MDAERIEAMAAALVAAQQAEQAAAIAVEELATYADGYAVQAAVFARVGAALTGWKVAAPPNGPAIAAPMLGLHQAGCRLPFRPGVGLEVELAIVLAHDLPAAPATPYRREDIVAAIASVHIGVEVVRSRLPDGLRSPTPAMLADVMANENYVLGPVVPTADLMTLATALVTVSRDGVSLFAGPGKHAVDDPLLPVLAYANGGGDALGGMRKGQLVTTGTLCGLVAVPAAGNLLARVGDHEMRFSLV